MAFSLFCSRRSGVGPNNPLLEGFQRLCSHPDGKSECELFLCIIYSFSIVYGMYYVCVFDL
jgi:hypothetical protein